MQNNWCSRFCRHRFNLDELLDLFNKLTELSMAKDIESNDKNINEAGVHSKKKFFGNRIYWRGSEIYKGFNKKYCQDFLDNILHGKMTSFNINPSKCVENTSRISFII
ncbi:hypothetical protein BpHYR1_034853 [Brachionus plicatilis]|uniref:Uncharacterized protein n=1 Tax=Brachionus plicatilis TaxID=10195 RepID=A0A3M7P876_BRAPC|nr:hypothetical protein BpHYR1_034853 [Brachionus plicatilis]